MPPKKKPRAPKRAPVVSEPVDTRFKRNRVPFTYEPARMPKFSNALGRSNMGVYPFIRGAINASPNYNPVAQQLMGQRLLYDPSAPAGSEVRQLNFGEVRDADGDVVMGEAGPGQKVEKRTTSSGTQTAPTRTRDTGTGPVPGGRPVPGVASGTQTDRSVPEVPRPVVPAEPIPDYAAIRRNMVANMRATQRMAQSVDDVGPQPQQPATETPMAQTPVAPPSPTGDLLPPLAPSAIDAILNRRSGPSMPGTPMPGTPTDVEEPSSPPVVDDLAIERARLPPIRTATIPASPIISEVPTQPMLASTPMSAVLALPPPEATSQAIVQEHTGAGRRITVDRRPRFNMEVDAVIGRIRLREGDFQRMAEARYARRPRLPINPEGLDSAAFDGQFLTGTAPETEPATGRARDRVPLLVDPVRAVPIDGLTTHEPQAPFNPLAFYMRQRGKRYGYETMDDERAIKLQRV